MARVMREQLGPLQHPKAVEIGCLKGRSAARILSYHPRIHLTSIDPFIPDSMAPQLIGSEKEARQLNTKAIEDGRYDIVADYSWNVVRRWADGALDMLFIDGDHRYKSVRRDLIEWTPKLRAGGVLFMHDCRMNRGGAGFHPGPSKLADEQLFWKASEWEVVGEAFSLAAFVKR